MIAVSAQEMAEGSVELDTPRKGAALGMEIVRSKDSYAGGLTAPSPKVPPYARVVSFFRQTFIFHSA